MKKIICELLIIHCSLFTVHAQWVQQNSGTSAGLAHVEFINRNTGWVCGTSGVILKTTNSGQNWISQSSGVTETLRDIHPVDSEVVYCVGIFETILKTTNGGNNWIVIREGVNPGKFFHGLNFINRNTGWICGSGQWVLKTIDGCNTFDSSSIALSYAWDIYFKDSQSGLVCGENGTLFKSMNGGLNWVQILGGEASEFLEMSFVGNTGWLIGYNNRKVFRTTNFGSNWDSLARIPAATFQWGAASIFFSSLNIGYTSGDSGYTFKTTNGGFNWIRQVIPVGNGLGSLYFVNDTVGWAVGTIGTILHTTTGGQIVPVNIHDQKIPEAFMLYQNYPNPFNPFSRIKFDVPERYKVTLAVYNVLGELATILMNETLSSGTYEVKFDGSDLPSGIYFYQLETENFRISKKMILLK